MDRVLSQRELPPRCLAPGPQLLQHSELINNPINVNATWYSIGSSARALPHLCDVCVVAPGCICYRSLPAYKPAYKGNSNPPTHRRLRSFVPPRATLPHRPLPKLFSPAYLLIHLLRSGEPDIAPTQTLPSQHVRIIIHESRARRSFDYAIKKTR